MKQYTPMIQQYLQIKEHYKDAFLFFRLGDFYEMFFQDATKASHILEITLTSRDGGGSERIPMCGVPHHSAQGYIDTLISKGYKVAICEQVEDPKTAKGVVKRDVVQLITPGTVMDLKGLEKENNYLSSVTKLNELEYGFVYGDITTGELNVTTIKGPLQIVINEILTVEAKELVIDESLICDEIMMLQEKHGVVLSIHNHTNSNEIIELWESVKHDEKLYKTVARLINYCMATQKRSLSHLQEPKIYAKEQFLKMDLYSKRNLEIAESIRTKDRKGTLLWLLDETKTSMGSRLLKQWLDRPLLSQNAIEERQQIVEAFLQDFIAREELRGMLHEVYDLERLAGRVAYGSVNPRELVQLRRSLHQVPFIREIVERLQLQNKASFLADLDPLTELRDLLDKSLLDSPTMSVKEGNIIREGYSEELDQYRDAKINGQVWIAKLEQQEREITGIKSLKVGFNKVFGYYIEVTRANIANLPEGRYERKQTLSNAERYITPELKEKEALILEAEAKMVDLEYSLYVSIREKAQKFIPELQLLAKAISTLDVLQGFATIAEKYYYCKPTFNHKHEMNIKNGRHPVVEKVLGVNDYVPNDCSMGEDVQALLITGPNMSGKSTFMRQVALISIMAQTGSYVPADAAHLPIFDQVFTRIGAADDLASGQSTFMVEMLEARNAIVHATKDSLLLFDEIGRGTSTFDGMALAQAMIEYIHDSIKAKTLFSTHYHELTSLENSLTHLQNVHVSAVEEDGHLRFLHKIREGAADKSYGIHVAKLADLPDSIIQRASEVLEELESMKELHVTVPVDEKKEVDLSNRDKKQEVVFETDQAKQKKKQKDNIDDDQLSLFAFNDEPALKPNEKAVLEQLKSTNVLTMTPMDAMNTLYDLLKKLS